jgi:hypothetical protein
MLARLSCNWATWSGSIEDWKLGTEYHKHTHLYQFSIYSNTSSVNYIAAYSTSFKIKSDIRYSEFYWEPSMLLYFHIDELY